MCLDAQVLVGGRHRRSPRAPTNVFKAERYSDKSSSGSVFLHDLRHWNLAHSNQNELCILKTGAAVHVQLPART